MEQDPIQIPICQSCGMPMEAAEDFGTDAGGGRNPEYCQYCWQDGEFTAKMDLAEFIEMQVKIATQNLGLPEDEAREVAETTLPELKRWQKAGIE
jgi:hypothetical protein